MSVFMQFAAFPRGQVKHLIVPNPFNRVVGFCGVPFPTIAEGPSYRGWMTVADGQGMASAEWMLKPHLPVTTRMLRLPTCAKCMRTAGDLARFGDARLP